MKRTANFLHPGFLHACFRFCAGLTVWRGEDGGFFCDPYQKGNFSAPGDVVYSMPVTAQMSGGIEVN
jgi:hypothetical protein